MNKDTIELKYDNYLIIQHDGNGTGFCKLCLNDFYDLAEIIMIFAASLKDRQIPDKFVDELIKRGRQLGSDEDEDEDEDESCEEISIKRIAIPEDIATEGTTEKSDKEIDDLLSDLIDRLEEQIKENKKNDQTKKSSSIINLSDFIKERR